MAGTFLAVFLWCIGPKRQSNWRCPTTLNGRPSNGIPSVAHMILPTRDRYSETSNRYTVIHTICKVLLKVCIRFSSVLPWGVDCINSSWFVKKLKTTIKFKLTLGQFKHVLHHKHCYRKIYPAVSVTALSELSRSPSCQRVSCYWSQTANWAPVFHVDQ